MNRWLKRLLVVLALVAVIVALKVTVFRSKPVPVTVFTVEKGQVENTVVNSRAGTVKSRRRAEMSPGISGLVSAIPVKKGERVRKGQVLLRLDDAEYKAQVNLADRSRDAAEAAADEACLGSDQAQRQYRRAQGLADQGLISDQSLEEARTSAESTAAGCKAAGEKAKQAVAQLQAARATLDKTVMTAPFDGVVLDVTVEVGEWISPSPPGIALPPVLDVIDPDSLYVSAPLDEADVASVRVGLPVRITMDAFRGRSFPGTLTYISSYVETRQEQNRTLTVEAEFSGKDLPANLLPGLSADIEVILETRNDVLRIPTYAILEGDKVLVVEGDKLVSRPVETGLHNWEFTQITSGLSAGDRVVVSLDRTDVKAGAKVTVAGETTK